MMAVWTVHHHSDAVQAAVAGPAKCPNSLRTHTWVTANIPIATQERVKIHTRQRTCIQVSISSQEYTSLIHTSVSQTAVILAISMNMAVVANQITIDKVVAPKRLNSSDLTWPHQESSIRC